MWGGCSEIIRDLKTVYTAAKALTKITRNYACPGKNQNKNNS